MSSMAVLAIFLRFARPSTVFDSLKDNAYGIYLVHYVIVTWVQYALLPAPWPGLLKGAVAFGGTVAMGWLATASGTVKRSGGWIWASNELGRGTTFTIDFPVPEP